jgi:hypothetical protein
MASASRFSRPTRTGLRRPLVLIAATLGIAAAVTLAAAAPRPDMVQQRFDGEFGLWVWNDRDSVTVHWITPEGGTGHLEVDVPRGRSITRTTPAGQAHRASFPRPSGDDLVLRYGAGGARLTTTHLSLSTPRRPPVTFRGVDSLYVVGDTHGAFDQLLVGLRRAGLIDESLRWAGGRRHLVFAGDLTDRGPDVLRLLWFVYRLEQEAARAGGRVHLVLGNHEILVFLGDLRYVHPKESAIAELHGVRYDRMFDVRHSVLGRWLISKPGMLRIDGVLIAHGGVTPEYGALRLDGFDRTLASHTAGDLFYQYADTTAVIRMDSASYKAWDDFFWSPRSIFWHREYVQSDTAGGQLDEALRLTGASTLVIGHTPVDSIHARYGGRVIAAHTPRMGAELLLLVRDGRSHRRFRITDAGAIPF